MPGERCRLLQRVQTESEHSTRLQQRVEVRHNALHLGLVSLRPTRSVRNKVHRGQIEKIQLQSLDLSPIYNQAYTREFGSIQKESLSLFWLASGIS